MKYKTIKYKNMEALILENSSNIFIKYNDTYTIKEILKFAYCNNYNNVCMDNFQVELSTTDFKKHFEDIFYKYMHKNSIPILNLSYNDINNKFEIQYGSKAIYESYPQLKNQIVYVVV